jgi:hypothetical protein
MQGWEDTTPAAQPSQPPQTGEGKHGDGYAILEERSSKLPHPAHHASAELQAPAQKPLSHLDPAVAQPREFPRTPQRLRGEMHDREHGEGQAWEAAASGEGYRREGQIPEESYSRMSHHHDQAAADRRNQVPEPRREPDPAVARPSQERYPNPQWWTGEVQNRAQSGGQDWEAAAYPSTHPSHPTPSEEGYRGERQIPEESYSRMPHHHDQAAADRQNQVPEPWRQHAQAVAQPSQEWHPNPQWRTGEVQNKAQGGRQDWDVAAHPPAHPSHPTASGEGYRGEGQIPEESYSAHHHNQAAADRQNQIPEPWRQHAPAVALPSQEWHPNLQWRTAEVQDKAQGGGREWEATAYPPAHPSHPTTSGDGYRSEGQTPEERYSRTSNHDQAAAGRQNQVAESRRNPDPAAQPSQEWPSNPRTGESASRSLHHSALSEKWLAIKIRGGLEEIYTNTTLK